MKEKTMSHINLNEYRTDAKGNLVPRKKHQTN